MFAVIEALEHGFVQRALIVGVLAGVACSMMGAFLVLRRQALFSDGIAHVAFGGIAVGLFAGTLPFWTAMAAAVAGGLGLQRLRSGGSVPGDAAVAVVLVSGLAAGILLISASGGFSTDLFGVLFGSILLISTEDALTVSVASAAVIGALLALRGQLLHIAFSEEQARASGMRVTLLNYVFVAMAAVMVVASMRLVGILLITALVVVPNVAAMALGMGFARTLAASAAVAAASVASGVLLSFYLDLAPSGAMVAAALCIMACALAWRRLR